MPACQGPQATVPDRSQLPRLSLHSQSAHSEANDSLRLAHSLPACATHALYPTFGNHRIYQLQHAETDSSPNVVRLLSVETECPPKVPICPHSAPKSKPKPKFGRPLQGMYCCPPTQAICTDTDTHTSKNIISDRFTQSIHLADIIMMTIIIIRTIRVARLDDMSPIGLLLTAVKFGALVAVWRLIIVNFGLLFASVWRHDQTTLATLIRTVFIYCCYI